MIILIIQMEELKSYFTISLNNDPTYVNRLNEEIEMLTKLDLLNFIKRFVEIFNKHIKQHLYLLRGSAGSSLLLYYLGINKIDPIKYNIPLSRFINKTRLVNPDIDIDLPSSLRDQIINDIITTNCDTVRISCNFNNEHNEFFESLIKEEPAANLIHNSGVVIFSEKDKKIIDDNKITDTQIKLTKDEICILNLKKIDLLSNTALEQLNKIHILLGKNITYDFNDNKVYDFMLTDDGSGITYAETSLIQYVIKILKPSNIEELSLCLAIIRPFAYNNINKYMTYDILKNKIIYDDDCIKILSDKLNLSEEEADKTRRMFKKNSDKDEIRNFVDVINKSLLSSSEKYHIKKILFRSRSYGFCKAHSINYGRLIYMLYYCKYYYPKIFWKSTLLSIKGYYNEWVYIRKGVRQGLKFKGIKKCDPFTHFIYTGYWLNKEFMSKCYLKIYEPVNKKNNNIVDQLQPTKDTVDQQTSITIYEDDSDIEDEDLSKNNQMIDDKDIDNYYLENDLFKQNKTNVNHEKQETITLNKECEFRGLIAGSTVTYTKYKKHQSVITIGYDNNKFIDLYLSKKRNFTKFKQVIGKGFYIDDVTPHIIITKMKIF